MKTMSLNNMPPSYFRTFLLMFAALVLAISLSSCGVFKKTVNKNKTEEKVKTEETTKTVTDTKTEAEITRTVTETFSTNIELEEKRVSDSTDLAKLLGGEEINFEDEDLSIKTRFDSVTKQVKTDVIKKKKTIPVQGTKKTEEKINQQQHQTVNSDQEKKTESKVKNKTKDKVAESDTGIPWYFWLFFFIVLLVLIWMVLKRFGII